MPPTAGLQDILAVSSSRTVTSAVLSPSRAQATAASQPAWPAPTITTSKASVTARSRSFPDAEAAEDPLQEIAVRAAAGHLSDRGQGLAQLEGHDLPRPALARRILGAFQGLSRPLERLGVARVAERGIQQAATLAGTQQLAER